VAKKEGRVKDLAEKLERGEIIPKGALKRLEERGLAHKEGLWDYIPFVVCVMLWLLPLFVEQTRSGFLGFLFSTIDFPTVVIYLSIVVLAITFFMFAWALYLLHTKGRSVGPGPDTLFLVKEGPYRIIRHPSEFSVLIGIILLPIALSVWIPFTILAIAAIIVMATFMCYQILYGKDKEVDIEKWGDAYTQYAKEVPAINIVKGLWNLRKRGN
jgi:protein-S-isoprenylcysteine O-methyltransferase Ste14